MASSRNDGRSRAGSGKRISDWNETYLVIEGGNSFEHELEQACPSLRTPFTELESLVAFLHWWKQHRTRWGLLYWIGHGPGGYGCANGYYQPPGDGPAIQIAHRAMGKIRSGADVVGDVAIDPVIPREEVVAGVVLEERILRRGGKFGESGEQTGGVFRCGALIIQAERCAVKLSGLFTLDDDALRTLADLIHLVDDD